MNPEFSISQVVSNSWNRMVQVLFKPFDFHKWLILALCAWLVNMNFGGGNFNLPPETFSGLGDADTPGEALVTIWEQLVDTLGIPGLVGIGFGVFVVFPAILIVLLWVKSRFDFIFLHNLVWNRQEVKIPWAKYKRQGNSLFLAQLAIAIVLVLFVAILAFALISLIIKAAGTEEILPLMLIPLLITIPFVIATSLLYFAISNLVVPIMYHKNLLFCDAFKTAYDIICRHPGKFLLLILLNMGLGIVFTIALLAAIVATCCLILLVMIIPVIGTMPLLPALVFFRYLGPEFLAAIDPDMNLFAPEAIPVEPENADC